MLLVQLRASPPVNSACRRSLIWSWWLSPWPRKAYSFPATAGARVFPLGHAALSSPAGRQVGWRHQVPGAPRPRRPRGPRASERALGWCSGLAAPGARGGSPCSRPRLLAPAAAPGGRRASPGAGPQANQRRPRRREHGTGPGFPLGPASSWARSPRPLPTAPPLGACAGRVAVAGVSAAARAAAAAAASASVSQSVPSNGGRR